MEQTPCSEDKGYDQYVSTITLPNEALFTTDVDLWPIYLNSFSDIAERQYHNCHTCRNFIQRYGTLVTIDQESGTQISAVWKPESAPAQYRPAITAMKNAVERAVANNIFFSSDKVLGVPVTGQWTHFAMKNNKIHKSFLTAGQYAAERREDYRNVSRGIGGFKISLLEQVVELLSNDSLYRSEKVLGQAEWLFRLKTLTTTTKNQKLKKNIIWKMVADAPSGFCHPRSSMIGTLLDDLSSGVLFSEASRRFAEKMHPLQYQRPSAAPTSGAILAAEKRVKELGVDMSLDRRYATIEDIQLIWTPKEEPANKNKGVFDHLRQESVPVVSSVSGKITWQRFKSEILPNSRKIEIQIPAHKTNYRVFVSAVHKDAPVIFQWGNCVSWYHWNGGSSPQDFCLQPGWCEVIGVCSPPYIWGDDKFTHFKEDASFIIKGARETKNQGNAIFPETLKSEFHSIRSVIEAHSRKTKIQDLGGSHVVGLGIGSKVRVYTSIVTQWEIDRLC